ncbi:MAG: serine/threonine protein kinase [bacterium]|nr:serine/threonine protein kinase [bacterium]
MTRFLYRRRAWITIGGALAYLIVCLVVILTLGVDRRPGTPVALNGEALPEQMWFAGTDRLVTVERTEARLTVVSWELPEGTPQRSRVELPTLDSGEPAAYAVAPNGRSVAWIEGGRIFVRDLEGGVETDALAHHLDEGQAGVVQQLALVMDRSSDRLVAAIIYENGDLQFWDYSNLENLGGSNMPPTWRFAYHDTDHLVVGSLAEKDVMVMPLHDLKDMAFKNYFWEFPGVTALCVVDGGVPVLGTERGNIFRPKANATWDTSPERLGVIHALAPGADGSVYAGGDFDGIYRLSHDLLEKEVVTSATPTRLLSVSDRFLAFSNGDFTGFVELNAERYLAPWVKSPGYWLAFILGFIGTLATLIGLTRAAPPTGGSTPPSSGETDDRDTQDAQVDSVHDDPPIAVSDIAPGGKIGRYEALAYLGQGGMGVVLRARDPQLDREVAIKIVSEKFSANDTAMARFKSEARAIAQLRHPNILTIHDIGQTGELIYLVTELLEGQTLEQRIKEGRSLAPADALKIVALVAVGLSAAHEKGIVHRDIKPGNIFLTRDQESKVKIFDFGLAQTVPVEPGDPATRPTVQHHTSPGHFIGTPGYSSPEQVRVRPLDERTDMFSLGCVLYELLTGDRPFIRETMADTAAAVLLFEPPSVTTVDESLPEALGGIVHRCLAKEPEDRFASMRELLAELVPLIRELDDSWQEPLISRDTDVDGSGDQDH